jgi:hypothetical protein
MKTYIQDKTLLFVLASIEKQLGYEVSSALLPEQQRDLMGGAVDMSHGQWRFLYNPTDYPSQLVMCHELMHIVLWIEGWPAWKVFPFAIRDRIDGLLYDFIINMPQHIAISRMVVDLGYTEREKAERDMDKLAQKMKEKSVVPQYHQAPWLKIQAIGVAELLLVLSDPLAKKHFRISLQQSRPLMLSLVDTICEAVLKRQPLDSQSYECLVYDILELLQMQKETLRPSRFDNACPDFFARICRHVALEHK